MFPKILLVDDNHDSLDILELILYKEFNIMTAMNGFEGLKIAQEEKPSLVITDIMMPVMDGIRFFNRLRKSDSINNVPIIAITAFQGKISRKSLMNMGFNEVISKPFDFEKTRNTILFVLKKSPGSADRLTGTE